MTRASKRQAHFGRDRTGVRWAAADFLAGLTGRAYFGQPVCIRCGRDEWGFEWPNCDDLAWPAWMRRTAHELTCQRYEEGGDDWVCAPCESDLVEALR